MVFILHNLINKMMEKIKKRIITYGIIILGISFFVGICYFSLKYPPPHPIHYDYHYYQPNPYPYYGAIA